MGRRRGASVDADRLVVPGPATTGGRWRGQIKRTGTVVRCGGRSSWDAVAPVRSSREVRAWIDAVPRCHCR